MTEWSEKFSFGQKRLGKAWSEKYNVHRLDLLHGHFSVVVYWDTGGYRVSCRDHTLKKKFKELDEAKAAGVELAKKLVHQILAELGEYEKGGW